MNRVYIVSILTFVSTIIISCTFKCKRPHKDGVIDVDNAIYSSTVDYTKDYNIINVIPLQEAEEHLLNARSHVVYADSNGYIIQSDMLLFRFDRYGRFMNTIGSLGNGPNEHTRIYNISVDQEKELVYMYVGQNKIIVKSTLDESLNTIILHSDDDISFAKVLKDKIIAEGRKYDKNGHLTVSIITFSLDGEKMNSEKLHEYGELPVSLQASPITYMYNKSIIYKDLYTGQSYELRGDSLEKHLYYELGELSPTREMLEDMRVRDNNRDTFTEIVDLCEDKRNVFILCISGRSLYGCVINKKTGEIVFSDKITTPQRGGGIPINEELTIWPMYIDDNNVLYSLVDYAKQNGQFAIVSITGDCSTYGLSN